MRRLRVPARPDWQERVERQGLLFHTHQGKPYWFEEACYQLSSREVTELEKATNTLHEMCLEAVDFVIQNRRWPDLAIRPDVASVIEQVWEADPPSLYGRFDLSYDGLRPPKLLEYNADTPTSLLEAAVIQWQWLQETRPQADQFNSIWEGLVEKWRDLKEENLLPSGLHFAHEESLEDLMTVGVLRDTAQEAGVETIPMHMADIGWDSSHRRFVDLEGRTIYSIFKLYPWEFMVQDAFGAHALANMTQTHWIEPIWKMVLSNKALLAILWEMHPDHPNLLPAYLDGPRNMQDWVKKPKLGREGANVTVQRAGQQTATLGEYGAEGFVWQQWHEPPFMDGSRPIIGSWVIDGVARGIGIRETEGLVTDDLARFVPHWFD